MIAGAAVALRVVEEFVIGLDIVAGQGFFAHELVQRRGGEQPVRKAQSADDRAAVAFFRQVARVDRRRVAGAVRFDLDVAARQRPHIPGAGAGAGCLFQFADLTALEAAPTAKRDTKDNNAILRELASLSRIIWLDINLARDAG